MLRRLSCLSTICRLSPRHSKLQLFERTAVMDTQEANGCQASMGDIKLKLKVILSDLNLNERKTHDLCTFYKELEKAGKITFLTTLAQDYCVNHASIAQLSQTVIASQDKDESILLRAEEKLKNALIPKYNNLFHEIGRMEGGVKFLVDFRTDILTMLEMNEFREDTPHLRILNTTLRDLIALWFTVGFLELERITWQSPCDILQKISDYEAVHPMKSWTDLKRRVGPYRRCFVFTHSSMPREPIVVLHTALTSEISSSIQSIVSNPRMHSLADISTTLEREKVEDAEYINTAIFYSISTTQKGLLGVELGNYLIKRVVRELQNEFPKMYKFSSLSPIPGFTDWLVGELKKQEKGEIITLFTELELTTLCELLQKPSDQVLECFRKMLAINSWVHDAKFTDFLKVPLMRLCARYLYLEKRRGYALNGVANFHLRNGAVMWRLNWLADRTPRGLSQSCGMMVNYRYFLEKTESNSSIYLETQKIETTSSFLEWIQDYLPMQKEQEVVDKGMLPRKAASHLVPRTSPKSTSPNDLGVPPEL